MDIRTGTEVFSGTIVQHETSEFFCTLFLRHLEETWHWNEHVIAIKQDAAAYVRPLKIGFFDLLESMIVLLEKQSFLVSAYPCVPRWRKIREEKLESP